MNRRQERAIRNPCYLAEECTQARYFYSDGHGNVCLTVNSGFE